MTTHAEAQVVIKLGTGAADRLAVSGEPGCPNCSLSSASTWNTWIEVSSTRSSGHSGSSASAGGTAFTSFYHGRRPYYAGLAHDLWVRLKQHLADRHRHRWNRVSVYMTTDARRLHEIEALAHHILQPIFKGNEQVGRFPGSVNLVRPFLRTLRQAESRKIKGLTGIPKRKVRVQKAIEDKAAPVPVLAKYAAEATGETCRSMP